MSRPRFALFLTVLSLSLPLAWAQYAYDAATELSNVPAGRALLQVYTALTSSYLGEVDEAALLEGAIEGMVEALDDPFTSYKTPAESRWAEQERRGSFGGIGATLEVHNRAARRGVRVAEVYRGGPADRAGLEVGDLILSVDGVDVAGDTVQEVDGRLRGARGTRVELGVWRAGRPGVQVVGVVREQIEVAFVASALLPNRVGYIRIDSFESQVVYSQLLEHLSGLQAQDIGSLILDLRDNGGGYLNQAVLVADLFLSEGDIAFQRSQGATHRLAGADPSAVSLPMVVLINGASASASEIVAGALQDNGRARIIGEQSFGKGVGQSLVSLVNGGELKLVSFEWLTPKRHSIQSRGITPDIRVDDSRHPEPISLSGRGAEPGQQIEIFAGGRKLGVTAADEAGEFSFVATPITQGPSGVPGRAVVDFGSDDILSTAHTTVRQEFAGPP